MPELDLTKPVQTRDGKPVRILCIDRKSPGNRMPLTGLIDLGDTETNTSWRADGTHAGGEALDLVNIPEDKFIGVRATPYHAGVSVEIATHQGTYCFRLTELRPARDPGYLADQDFDIVQVRDEQ